jgi:hypothetical protein
LSRCKVRSGDKILLDDAGGGQYEEEGLERGRRPGSKDGAVVVVVDASEKDSSIREFRRRREKVERTSKSRRLEGEGAWNLPKEFSKDRL